MLVGITSRPSSITSQIPPQALLNYGPWIVPNCPKLAFPLSKSKSFHPFFIKLGEHVGRHNISTKFYNQPYSLRHSWIMALELSKIVQNKRFCSLSQRVFIQFLSNLVNMLVGIISRPSAITCQIPLGTPELWPLNCSKLGFPLSNSKSFRPVLIKLGEHVGRHNILTKFFNQPNPPRHSWIMALELSKNWLAVSALQVEYPAPKNVVITIEFTTTTTGVFCVSLALLFQINFVHKNNICSNDCFIL